MIFVRAWTVLPFVNSDCYDAINDEFDEASVPNAILRKNRNGASNECAQSHILVDNELRARSGQLKVLRGEFTWPMVATVHARRASRHRSAMPTRSKRRIQFAFARN